MTDPIHARMADLIEELKPLLDEARTGDYYGQTALDAYSELKPLLEEARTGDYYGQTALDAYSIGILSGKIDTASDALFDVINIANAHCDSPNAARVLGEWHL